MKTNSEEKLDQSDRRVIDQPDLAGSAPRPHPASRSTDALVSAEHQHSEDLHGSQLCFRILFFLFFIHLLFSSLVSFAPPLLSCLDVRFFPFSSFFFPFSFSFFFFLFSPPFLFPSLSLLILLLFPYSPFFSPLPQNSYSFLRQRLPVFSILGGLQMSYVTCVCSIDFVSPFQVKLKL